MPLQQEYTAETWNYDPRAKHLVTRVLTNIQPAFARTCFHRGSYALNKGNYTCVTSGGGRNGVRTTTLQVRACGWMLAGGVVSRSTHVRDSARSGLARTPISRLAAVDPP